MNESGGLLVYLYGPPASGKLTVAECLVARTGMRLFHNHLTVDALTPVFNRHSDEFRDVLHRLRLDVFATAAAAGVDVVFTNNSAWGGADGRERFAGFAETVGETVRAQGGRVVFVQLHASTQTLHERLGSETRHAHGKLRDPVRLGELLATHDSRPLHASDVVIDTDRLDPAESVDRIIEALSVREIAG